MKIIADNVHLVQHRAPFAIATASAVAPWKYFTSSPPGMLVLGLGLVVSETEFTGHYEVSIVTE